MLQNAYSETNSCVLFLQQLQLTLHYILYNELLPECLQKSQVLKLKGGVKCHIMPVAVCENFSCSYNEIMGKLCYS